MMCVSLAESGFARHLGISQAASLTSQTPERPFGHGQAMSLLHVTAWATVSHAAERLTQDEASRMNACMLSLRRHKVAPPPLVL